MAKFIEIRRWKLGSDTYEVFMSTDDKKCAVSFLKFYGYRRSSKPGSKGLYEIEIDGEPYEAQIFYVPGRVIKKEVNKSMESWKNRLAAHNSIFLDQIVPFEERYPKEIVKDILGIDL